MPPSLHHPPLPAIDSQADLPRWPTPTVRDHQSPDSLVMRGSGGPTRAPGQGEQQLQRVSGLWTLESARWRLVRPGACPYEPGPLELCRTGPAVRMGPAVRTALAGHKSERRDGPDRSGCRRASWAARTKSARPSTKVGNERDQVQPAAVVGVMQPSDGDGDGREEQAQKPYDPDDRQGTDRPG